MSQRPFGAHHRLHRHLLNTGPGGCVGSPARLALALQQQASGDHKCAAEDDRRGGDDMAHGQQFLLA
ncbi:hypothetical protein D9M68_685920 [compost metagenome]